MRKAIVTSIIGDVYVRPDGSELADEVLYGYVVELLEDMHNGWYRIRTHYNYEGYLHEEDISTVNVSVWEKTPKWVVTGTNSCVDILSEPNIKACAIMSATKGCIFAETNENTPVGWVCVTDACGRRGYIRAKFLQKEIVTWNTADEAKIRDAVVAEAMSYMGTQYRWGGKTVLGVDCSGLCSMAYMSNGVIIYRDAKIVDGFAVREISFNDVKKGDLLYFPGHIAMYIGDGRYIHSSASNDGVSINSLTTGDDGYREDLAKSIKAAGSVF